MTTKPEIVKVQLDLNAKDGLKLLQVSNEDETLHWVGAPVEGLKKLLGDRDRAYFYARVENRKLLLGQEAPAQKW